MTNIRQQAVVSLIIVVLSAAAAAGTPPVLRVVPVQYGVGTQLYAITSEGIDKDRPQARRMVRQ
jgi:hypothetical protein